MKQNKKNYTNFRLDPDSYTIESAILLVVYFPTLLYCYDIAPSRSSVTITSQKSDFQPCRDTATSG